MSTHHVVNSQKPRIFLKANKNNNIYNATPPIVGKQKITLVFRKKVKFLRLATNKFRNKSDDVKSKEKPLSEKKREKLSKWKCQEPRRGIGREVLRWNCCCVTRNWIQCVFIWLSLNFLFSERQDKRHFCDPNPSHPEPSSPSVQVIHIWTFPFTHFPGKSSLVDDDENSKPNKYFLAFVFACVSDWALNIFHVVDSCALFYIAYTRATCVRVLYFGVHVAWPTFVHARASTVQRTFITIGEKEEKNRNEAIFCLWKFFVTRLIFFFHEKERKVKLYSIKFIVS